MLSLYNNVVIFAHYLTHNTEVMKKKIQNIVAIPVTTAGDVFTFFYRVCRDLGVNLHPDTPFGEYVDYETDKPSFNKAEIAALDAVLDTCFDVCRAASVDIYEISIDATENAMIEINHKAVVKDLKMINRNAEGFALAELQEWGRVLPDNYEGRVVTMNGTPAEILRFDPRMNRPGRHWSVICSHNGSNEVRFSPTQLAAGMWQMNREKWGLERQDIKGW